MLVTGIFFFSHNVFVFASIASEVVIADDKSNVTQNIRVVFHRIENIVGKEENAGDQHFLFFPQCFRFFFPSISSKVVIADDKSNVTQNIKVVFYRIENIVGKEENAGYKHFLLFSQCFRFCLHCVKSRHCVVMGEAYTVLQEAKKFDIFKVPIAAN